MKFSKLKILTTSFLLLILMSTISFASYSNVTMSVVKEPICTIEFGENSKFTKQIISKDLSSKEVTLQLQVTNDEGSSKPTGELMLVIDNSKSMLDIVSETTTREDLVISSAKALIENLLEDNTQLKIGIVGFSTNTDVSKEGTSEDAKLISNLTNDSSALISAISSIQYDGPRTDLDAGITLASEYFTSNVDSSHKYMIVLTDGVPNVALNYDNQYFSDDVISKTKSKLQTLSSSIDNIIIMLTGISNGSSLATGTTKTYDQIIQEIFGTTTNPTVGKFYYVTDSDIEKTITNDIYSTLIPIGKTLTDITIVDYFPAEIINNFSFSYVKEATIGTISATVNKTNNSITWTIPELQTGETATVQYKLKLNENYSSSIVDKVLNTNTKVDINYTDYNGETGSKTSDVSPQIKLTEPDETVATTIIPKTGKTTLFIFITIIIFVAITFGVRYIVLNNKNK